MLRNLWGEGSKMHLSLSPEGKEEDSQIKKKKERKIFLLFVANFDEISLELNQIPDDC